MATPKQVDDRPRTGQERSPEGATASAGEHSGCSFESTAQDALFEAVGWLTVGLLNVPFVVALSSARTWSDRAGQHLFDLSHFALLGSLAGVLYAGTRWGWRRWARTSSRRVLVGATLVVVLTVLARWATYEDLVGFLARQSLPSWVPARELAALLVVAGVLFVSAAAERWVTRRLGLVALAVVALLVLVNNLVLPPDYPGAHLALAAISARVASVAGRRLNPRWLLRGAGRLLVGAALVCGVSASLLVRPSMATWRRLYEVPGSVLAPFLSSMRLAVVGANAWIPKGFRPWFVDRSGLAPIPAHAPTVLPSSPLVILLTIDALRADVMASREHDGDLPELARLRDASVSFTMARAPSPSTLTTVMALFTGKYYSQTYWTTERGKALPTRDTTRRLAEILEANRVRTVHVAALHGLGVDLGVGKGFGVERLTSRDYGRARQVMDLILEELGRRPARPTFIYAHFVDSHAPYTLAGTDGTPFENYLGELALSDVEVERLQAYLDRSGLRSRTVLIVTSDHGEAFGEHGMNYHARSVYEELVRVPLMVQLPSSRTGRDIGVPVTLLDLTPTILDLFGIPTPGDMLGESLVPALRGERFEPTRPIAVDSGRRIQALYFPDGVKALRDLTRKTMEVYDLSRDPDEMVDLIETEPSRAERYIAALDRFFVVHTLRRPGWEPPWRKF